MEHGPLRIRTLDAAHRYVRSLSTSEQRNIATEITLLSEGNPSVRTKLLRSPVRELVVGNHRVTYFKLESTLYFVRGFRKKSQMTPRKEIEYAEEVYRKLSAS